MHIPSRIILAAAALAMVSACSSDLNEEEQAIYDARIAEENKKPTNLAAVVRDQPELATASMLLALSGVAAELKDDGPFTSFAASNDAFNKLDADKLKGLMAPENKTELAGIAKYSMTDGSITSADIAKAIADGGGTASITTLQGGAIKVSMDGDKIVLEDSAGNKATVVKADIESSNGVLHIVDTVLMPG